MPGRFICDRCGDTIPPHAHYVVKIQVYADPSLPAVTTDDLEETDYDARVSDLLKEMEHLSEEELENAVHWQREFKVCRPCQLRLLRDPLGAGPPPSSPP
jgi:ribosomal protein L40E